MNEVLINEVLAMPEVTLVGVTKNIRKKKSTNWLLLVSRSSARTGSRSFSKNTIPRIRGI